MIDAGVKTYTPWQLLGDVCNFHTPKLETRVRIEQLSRGCNTTGGVPGGTVTLAFPGLAAWPVLALQVAKAFPCNRVAWRLPLTCALAVH